MTFLRPYRLVQKDHHCIVVDALGDVVATGRREMCERVVAGLPIFSRLGSLFK